MNVVENHTSPATHHLPMPELLNSDTQACHFLPPASNRKVCNAMTKENIAAATSPRLSITPCKLQNAPGKREFSMIV